MNASKKKKEKWRRKNQLSIKSAKGRKFTQIQPIVKPAGCCLSINLLLILYIRQGYILFV